jgi:hypothetical protein
MNWTAGFTWLAVCFGFLSVAGVMVVPLFDNKETRELGFWVELLLVLLTILFGFLVAIGVGK